MLVDVRKYEETEVDFIGVKDLEGGSNTVNKGGDLMSEVMKEYEDNSPAGKWSVGEYFALKDSTGGYNITSGTQFKEKCDSCNIDTPCCMANCEVYEYKQLEGKGCSHCKFDGVCYGSMDSLKDYHTEFAKGEFRVKHNGKYWTLGGISRLETSVDKLILYFKYVNMAYRYYGCEELMFKVKKSEDKVIVSFQEELYEFPRNMSKKEVMLKVFRRVSTYRLSA